MSKKNLGMDTEGKVEGIKDKKKEGMIVTLIQPMLVDGSWCKAFWVSKMTCLDKRVAQYRLSVPLNNVIIMADNISGIVDGVELSEEVFEGINEANHMVKVITDAQVAASGQLLQAADDADMGEAALNQPAEEQEVEEREE